MNEWHSYVVEKRAHDLDAIIEEEKLNPKDTRKFMKNAFRDGEIRTFGTDIDKLMPPISRFGGGGRAKKKQSRNKAINYGLVGQKELSMVAESKMPYGKKSQEKAAPCQSIQK